MKIWQCKYEEFVNGEVITSIKQFDDRDILLDCICESYEEMIKYMIGKCLGWCHEHKVKFVAFEIVAE